MNTCDQNRFQPGDLVKYRGRLETDFDHSGEKAYNELGVVLDSPTHWNESKLDFLGVLYVNNSGDFILVHQDDLILIGRNLDEKLL